MAGSQSRSSLAGLKPLTGQTVYAIPPENILERSGGPADPRHGENQSGNPPYLTGPYPTPAGEQGAYGPSGLEDPAPDQWALGQGSYDPDQSPIGHGGPFPAHGATYGELRNGDAQSAAQLGAMALHSADFGTAELIEFNPQGTEYVNATFHRAYAESEGTTKTEGMRTPPTQLTGAGGGRDREVLGNGGNPIFKVAHIGQRRVQDDDVPFNSQWLDAAQRPFVVKHNGQKNTFDGQDSPYGAAGDETTNMMLSPDQAAVQTNATAYIPPADPSVAQAYTDTTAWAW